MGQKAIFFDLDGTLLDTIGDLCDAVNDALKEVGIPFIYNKQDCCQFIGNGVDMFMHRALGDRDDPDTFVRLKNAYLPKYREYQGRTTYPFPEMNTVLRSLKEKGILLFVCTNKPHPLANIIAREKLGDDLFTEIYGQIEGEPVKPNPHILNYFMQKYGLKPMECRMVGDSLPDLEIAENAGIKSALCTWGYGHYGPDLYKRAGCVIRSPRELLGIFDRRLFVFDIDQTIVPRGSNTISEKDLSAINSLLQQGNAVALASGRPFCSVSEYLQKMEPGEKYAICANGGAAFDQDGHCLSASYLHLDDIYHFRDRLLSDQISVYGYDSNGSLALFKDSYFIELEELLCHVDPKAFVWLPEKQPSDFDRDLLKVLIAADPSASAQIEFTKEEKERYTITRSDPMFLEVSVKGIDKAYQVERLREYLQIPAENVYCFGDNDNDATMLAAFNGVGMANATEAAKASAKIITKSCDESGVAYALEEILFAI